MSRRVNSHLTGAPEWIKVSLHPNKYMRFYQTDGTL
jgi:hypothetical protein